MTGRVVLHVGLAKTGTTYLQRLLASATGSLVVPGAFPAAVEVRGSWAKFGLPPTSGRWAAACAAAREQAVGGGVAILGHEVLAGATRAQIAGALAPFEGLPLDVVVTARDLGRQATAHWQEEVKLGDTRSFATFAADEVLADTGPDDGPDAGGIRPRFWHAQDFADCLARWTSTGARGHLVAGPAPGNEPAELWRRFAAACGIDPAVVVPGAEPANPSLGRDQIALLRAVNADLAGRMDTATRLRVVKRGYAEGVLAPLATDRPQAPAALEPLLAAATARFLAQVDSAGWAVHGPVADLTPVLAPPGAPPPDAPLPPRSHPHRTARRLLKQASRH